jgi:hypothetical protein
LTKSRIDLSFTIEFFDAVRFSYANWEFGDDPAFLALCDAFKESGTHSSIEFLCREGAHHFQELTCNAAGEGIVLSDSSALEEFQNEVIDAMEEICSRR